MNNECLVCLEQTKRAWNNNNNNNNNINDCICNGLYLHSKCVIDYSIVNNTSLCPICLKKCYIDPSSIIEHYTKSHDNIDIYNKLLSQNKIGNTNLYIYAKKSLLEKLIPFIRNVYTLIICILLVEFGIIFTYTYIMLYFGK